VLILLLILSMVYVFGRHTDWPCYFFMRQYLIFAVIVLVLGGLSGSLGQLIPRAWFHYEKKPFAPHSFEKEGHFYEKTFHIQKWKDFAFDLSQAFPGMVPKKMKAKPSTEDLKVMLQETCRAEVVHVLLIIAGNLLFWHFMEGWPRIVGMVLYTISNLGSLMIQRYNRPRLKRLKDLLKRREQAQAQEAQEAQAQAQAQAKRREENS